MTIRRRGCNLQIGTPRGVETWRLRFRPLHGKYGEVDWDKWLVNLDPRQSVEELVDTVIHEVGGHVATSDALSEDLIDKIAAGSTAALLRLGLIRTEDD